MYTGTVDKIELPTFTTILLRHIFCSIFLSSLKIMIHYRDIPTHPAAVNKLHNRWRSFLPTVSKSSLTNLQTNWNCFCYNNYRFIVDLAKLMFKVVAISPYYNYKQSSDCTQKKREKTNNKLQHFSEQLLMGHIDRLSRLNNFNITIEQPHNRGKTTKTKQPRFSCSAFSVQLLNRIRSK